MNKDPIPYLFVKRTGAYYMEVESLSGITKRLNNLIDGLANTQKHQQDYLQIFRLTIAEDGSQILQHSQENPHYTASYKLYILNPIHAKVYVIDDGDHSTMLLAEEY